MEFEEMKRIWDQQHQEPLYAINEEALHRSIKSTKKRASRLSNINDWGLLVVSIGTAIAYGMLAIIDETPTVYDYLIVAALLIIAAYVWLGRIGRKKKERAFARTMLGDLNHAIANVNYEAARAKNMVWWYIAPLTILTFLNMSQADVSLWKWIGLVAAFVFSGLLTRWELVHRFKPKQRKLEALRKKLTEDE